MAKNTAVAFVSRRLAGEREDVSATGLSTRTTERFVLCVCRHNELLSEAWMNPPIQSTGMSNTLNSCRDNLLQNTQTRHLSVWNDRAFAPRPASEDSVRSVTGFVQHFTHVIMVLHRDLSPSNHIMGWSLRNGSPGVFNRFVLLIFVPPTRMTLWIFGKNCA